MRQEAASQETPRAAGWPRFDGVLMRSVPGAPQARLAHLCTDTQARPGGNRSAPQLRRGEPGARHSSSRPNAVSGNNHWVPGTSANQSYLVLHSGLTAGNAIDKLLCQPPKHGH